jgi:SagB-type dehydrogenase family enzyme
MRVKIDAVDARLVGRSFLIDRDLTLPRRPRLIPELLILPFDEDGLLFVGGEQAQVLRGRSARSLLPRLLPLLDGRRTLDDLRGELPDVGPEAVCHAVMLLYSRGLMEDGAPGGTDGAGLKDVDSFLGRFIDVTRCNAGREQAATRLTGSRVLIAGPPDLAGAMVRQLRESGIARAEAAAEGTTGGPDAGALVVAISVGDRQRDDVPRQTAGGVGRPRLLVRLGAAEASLGPLLVPGETACARCLAKVHPHPIGEPDSDLALYWVGLASLQIVLALSRLGPGSLRRAFPLIHLDHARMMTQETRLMPRMPGCADCGIPGPVYEPDDPRLIAWVYHTASSIPDRDAVIPKDHQSHYSFANLKLASRENFSLFSPLVLPLPSLTDLSRPDPRTAEAPAPVAHSLGSASLGYLLSRAVGEVEDKGVRRRIAPTGGNLGSVDVWLVVRSMEGLPRGVYHYDARRHALASVREASDEAVDDALGASSGRPDVLLIGTGALAKCAQKYRSFAYRLIYMDSGIAIAYLYTLADALGLGLREYPDFDDARLAELVGLPASWEFPLPTFAVGLSPACRVRPAEPGPGRGRRGDEDPPDPARGDDRGSPPGSRLGLSPRDYSVGILSRLLDAASMPPRRRSEQRPGLDAIPRETLRPVLNSLEEVLMTRRAVREFCERPVRAAVLRDLAVVAENALRTRENAGAARCFVRPVLAVGRGAHDLSPGLYELEPSYGSLQKRAPFNADLMAQCVNQDTLAASPAALVMIGDLDASLTERGVRGYRELAQHAGAAVGQAWLAATAHGLVGTAAGGVIASGFRIASGMDGFRECPLLGLHLGHPRIATGATP